MRNLALLDPWGDVKVGGVPHFITTDSAGNELYRRAGALVFAPPVPEVIWTYLAASYRLIDPSSLEARNTAAELNAPIE